MSKETIQQLIERHIINNNGQWNHEKDEAWIFAGQGQFKITREEFNAAADRMRGKPDWKDAPDGYEWLAQNNVGVWWWYPAGESPELSVGCFGNNSDEHSAIRATEGTVIGDWRNTLEKRPKQKADPLNGYEWGKEYPTNGKKPDLPDDLEIETLSNCGGNWHKSNAGRPDWRFDGGMGDIVKFKITDQRYKPTEPAPAKPWFEAGDAPPAGTYCQVKQKNEFVNCYIVGLDDCGAIVYRIDGFYGAKMDQNSFRPIRTEREKTIDAADLAIHQYSAGADIRAELLGALYDAGLLRLPDNKKPD